MSIHMPRLPEPSDAHALEAESPLPLWHKDVAALDPTWADEAAKVLDLLSRSDYGMVKSNAIGGQGAAASYSQLLEQMQLLQEDTIRDQNKKPSGWFMSTWDSAMAPRLMSFTRARLPFLRDEVSLVDRMEALLRDRKTLVDNTRNRIHGLQFALEQRAEVDDRAMSLLAKLPELEEKSRVALDQATTDLADTPEDASFDVFRKNQLVHRSAAKVPQALTMVRDQLQNAVMLGAPLRDTIDQFISVEEGNQSQFEVSFSVHVSSLAMLQGMTQSKRNAEATQTIIKALPLPQFAALPSPDYPEKAVPAKNVLNKYSDSFMAALTSLEVYQKQNIKIGNIKNDTMDPSLLHSAWCLAGLFSQLDQHEKEKLITGVSVTDPLFPFLMKHANLPFQKTPNSPKELGNIMRRPRL